MCDFVKMQELLVQVLRASCFLFVSYIAAIWNSHWYNFQQIKKKTPLDLRVPDFILRDAKIAASERVKAGVTGDQLWLKINEPTEKDKGKYTMDIFDGKDGVKRVFDLSGKGERKF